MEDHEWVDFGSHHNNVEVRKAFVVELDVLSTLWCQNKPFKIHCGLEHESLQSKTFKKIWYD